MKKIGLLVLGLLVAFTLWGQGTGSVWGEVIDAQTGEGIPGVDIFIENTQLGTSTDEEGEFLLKNIPIGNYKVTASYVGYKKEMKKVVVRQNQSKKVSFILQEVAENLSEVVVTAKSKARKIREKAMPVSVISMEQLSGTVNSISDILNKTVGVTIRNTGGVGAAARISVRGLEGKRIGFFVDETPMNDHSDFLDINDIPMDMIERIEIYKGVVPAKFGGNAMGGAVNIVIKEYPDRYADMSYMLESFNTHKFQTVLKRNLRKQGILFGIGGGYTYSDNDYEMESPYKEGLKIKRKHDKFKKIMVGASLQATKWWFDEVEFEPIFMDTYKEMQGIEYDIREANVKSTAYIFANTLKKNDFLIEGLDLDFHSAIAYTKYGMLDTAKQWHDWDGIAYPTTSKYGGELGNRYASDSDNRKFTFVNKANFEYLINEKNSINFNSFYTYASGKPKDDLRELSLGKKTIFNSKMKSWTVGATYDFRTTHDKFLNSLTARYYFYDMRTKHTDLYGVTEVEDIHLKKNDFGISNAMRYRFSDTFLAKFSLGYDVRIPSESELLGDGYTIEPAEKLSPERNKSVNIGVMYDLLGKRRSNLQLELSGFYMHLEDMIRFVKGIIGAQYQNFGEMQTLGVEFEAKADVLPVLYAYTNITYQDLRDVREFEENSQIPNPTKDKRMPNIPNFMINAGLEFHKENLFGGTAQNTRVFTDLAFVEEYYYDFEMARNQRRVPRSTTFDLGVEHSFMNERLFVSGKIKNLTDAKVLSEFNRPLPGRSFGMKLRYIFK